MEALITISRNVPLEGNGAALLKGALEALSIPAFVCGSAGYVQALTAQAEDLVRDTRGLSLRNQRLLADRDEESRALNDAIMKAARGFERPGAPSMQAVVIRGVSEASSPLVLDVMSLPSVALESLSASRVLVVARGSRGADARKVALLRGVYGFTSAETDIALQLAQGKTTEAIARERKVAVGTVRAQIKSVLAKLAVRRQVELVVKLNEI